MRLPLLATLAAAASSFMGKFTGKEFPWEPPNERGYVPRRRGRNVGRKFRNPFKRISRAERRIDDWTRSCEQANGIQRIRQASTKTIRPSYNQAAAMFQAILRAEAKTA